jgi:hypothetical protein
LEFGECAHVQRVGITVLKGPEVNVERLQSHFVLVEGRDIRFGIAPGLIIVAGAPTDVTFTGKASEALWYSEGSGQCLRTEVAAQKGQMFQSSTTGRRDGEATAGNMGPENRQFLEGGVAHEGVNITTPWLVIGQVEFH